MPLSSEHAHVFPLPLPLLKAPFEFLLLDYLFDHTLLQPLCLLSCIVDVLRLHLYQKTVPRIRSKKLTVVSISFLEDFKEELMDFHPNMHRLVKSKIVPHNRVIFCSQWQSKQEETFVDNPTFKTDPLLFLIT